VSRAPRFSSPSNTAHTSYWKIALKPVLAGVPGGPVTVKVGEWATAVPWMSNGARPLANLVALCSSEPGGVPMPGAWTVRVSQPGCGTGIAPSNVHWFENSVHPWRPESKESPVRTFVG
jgi:hypothetical protein